MSTRENGKGGKGRLRASEEVPVVGMDQLLTCKSACLLLLQCCRPGPGGLQSNWEGMRMWRVLVMMRCSPSVTAAAVKILGRSHSEEREGQMVAENWYIRHSLV